MLANRPLLRALGVGFGLAVVVGGTIGLGILRSPAVVAGHAGSAAWALAFWVLGGLYAVFAAAAYADLATSLSRSGGVYVYAREALGDGAGFLYGWADLLATCSTIAFAGLGFAEFAALLFPALEPWRSALAVLAIVAFVLGQLPGVRVSSGVHQAGAALKALLFLVLVGGLLFLAPAVETEAVASAATRSALPTLVGVVLAMQLVLGAYDGWAGGIYFTGEDREPARNPPRAILGGVLVVIVVYLAMNLALLRVLPFEVLVASPLPAADAARTWLGEGGSAFVTLVAAISLLPLLNGTLLVSSRIAHAMACDGLLPAALAKVGVRGTPVPALLAVGAAGIAMVFASGGVLNLVIAMGALFAVFAYTGGFLSLIVLRRRQPALPRPFRAPGHPYSTVLLLLASAGLCVGVVLSAPGDSLLAMVALALAWPLHRLRAWGAS